MLLIDQRKRNLMIAFGLHINKPRRFKSDLEVKPLYIKCLAPGEVFGNVYRISVEVPRGGLGLNYHGCDIKGYKDQQRSHRACFIPQKKRPPLTASCQQTIIRVIFYKAMWN